MLKMVYIEKDNQYPILMEETDIPQNLESDDIDDIGGFFVTSTHRDRWGNPWTWEECYSLDETIGKFKRERTRYNKFGDEYRRETLKSVTMAKAMRILRDPSYKITSFWKVGEFDD